MLTHRLATEDDLGALNALMNLAIARNQQAFLSPAQVESLRKDGRSWGQAAEELGVHPGFLGIGKAPIYEPASVRKAARAERAKAAQPKGKSGKKMAEPAPAKAVKKSGKPGAKTLATAKPEKSKATGKSDKPVKKKKHKKPAE